MRDCISNAKELKMTIRIIVCELGTLVVHKDLEKDFQVTLSPESVTIRVLSGLEIKIVDDQDQVLSIQMILKNRRLDAYEARVSACDKRSDRVTFRFSNPLEDFDPSAQITGVNILISPVHILA
jgi:hypothetical protein